VDVAFQHNFAEQRLRPTSGSTHVGPASGIRNRHPWQKQNLLQSEKIIGKMSAWKHNTNVLITRSCCVLFA